MSRKYVQISMREQKGKPHHLTQMNDRMRMLMGFGEVEAGFWEIWGNGMTSRLCVGHIVPTRDQFRGPQRTCYLLQPKEDVGECGEQERKASRNCLGQLF